MAGCPQVCTQLPTSQTNRRGRGRCRLRLKTKQGDGLSQRYSASPPEEVAGLRLAGTGSRGMLHQPAGQLAPSPPRNHEENQQLPRRAGQGVWTTHFKTCRCGTSAEEPACQDVRRRRPGKIPASGRSLEKEMTTHSSLLAWRIPRTEEPGGLPSTELQRVRHD